MRFSQRMGHSPSTKLAQLTSMDDELRNSLWSLITLFYWESYTPHASSNYALVKGSNLHNLVFSLWLHYFKEPVDTIDEYWDDCLGKLRKYFFSAEWFEIYDFIEFVASEGFKEVNAEFVEFVNKCLVRENSAYRFVDGRITEITSAEEIEEVESALQGGGEYPGVQTHLKTALALLSDRKSPDYRNSIKESISAVESLAKQLVGNESGTLGGVLKRLEQAKKLHPAMKNAFSSLYGYSSDADGIRHALLEESNLTKADARFMLVCCSAFINYSLEAVKT